MGFLKNMYLLTKAHGGYYDVHTGRGFFLVHQKRWGQPGYIPAIRHGQLDMDLGKTNFIEVIMVETKQMIIFWVKQKRKSKKKKKSTVSAFHSLESL